MKHIAQITARKAATSTTTDSSDVIVRLIGWLISYISHRKNTGGLDWGY